MHLCCAGRVLRCRTRRFASVSLATGLLGNFSANFLAYTTNTTKAKLNLKLELELESRRRVTVFWQRMIAKQTKHTRNLLSSCRIRKCETDMQYWTFTQHSVRISATCTPLAVAYTYCSSLRFNAPYYSVQTTRVTRCCLSYDVLGTIDKLLPGFRRVVEFYTRSIRVEIFPQLRSDSSKKKNRRAEKTVSALLFFPMLIGRKVW